MNRFDLTRDGRLTVIVWSLVSYVLPVLGLVAWIVWQVRTDWPLGTEAQRLTILANAIYGLIFVQWTVVLAQLIVLGLRAFKGSLSAQGGLNLDVTADGGATGDKLIDAGQALADAGSTIKAGGV